MRSIEEIIETLENGTWWDYLLNEIPEGDHGDLCDAIDAAVAKLKTHPEAQPNEPLTLEELLEMDGKPVWMDFAGGLWAVVDAPRRKLWAGRAGQYAMSNFERRIYRRPPEEETK